ncbi:unnamed protein product, partial [marine sediment metagenome]
MAFIAPIDAQSVDAGTSRDLFKILGLQVWRGKPTYRAFVPGARNIDIIDAKTGKRILSLTPVSGTDGLFTGQLKRGNGNSNYKLRISNGQDVRVIEDAYRFGPVLGELDEYLIGEGSHQQLWEILGANIIIHEGVEGTHFALWAPNASRVSVVGGSMAGMVA